MKRSSTVPSRRDGQTLSQKPGNQNEARGINYESPAAKFGFGILGAVLLLGLWQFAAIRGTFGNGLPTVSATLIELFALFGNPEFWTDTFTTIWLAVLGMVIAVVAGVMLGLLIGTIDWVRYATLAVTEFFKPIPPIVVLPLCVMIWGPTNTMALALVLLGTVLSTTIQVIAGVNDTDPVALSTARSYGMGRVERLLRVTLPSASPYIGTSVRIGAPAALIIVVVAGLLGGAPGLGSAIYRSQSAGDFPQTYALVLVLGVLGLVAQNLSSMIERRVLHWHPAFREDVK
ncbi:nitrate ABC transporter permease [Arthrobacter sp. MYb224]|uniref:ABC transporter permease n=1 Tax=unclassified Arthrobacter TaxID=235627 RepID=UPI000CFB95FD|nr:MULTISPECIES: ABC transporter permease subunit [unclassified Arthrobacter]PRA00435.1 nitrate ABC transporter permease [Arthrobacter sp. MYb224]PRA04627.1 nitrate ABC transporter permease [Arthrobacter sp. MYb229]PRB51461.1 nitrate ABC transporter permease [Arthrobacter sp. MYb216]